jgi:hypothetical protein
MLSFSSEPRASQKKVRTKSQVKFIMDRVWGATGMFGLNRRVEACTCHPEFPRPGIPAKGHGGAYPYPFRRSGHRGFCYPLGGRGDDPQNRGTTPPPTARMAEKWKSARRLQQGPTVRRQNQKRVSMPQPAMPNGKCRFHGGRSTGPRTSEGLERMR